MTSDARIAPLFLLSTHTKDAPPPFVFEHMVTRDNGSDSDADGAFDAVAYGRQLALLRRWRDGLDRPGQAAAASNAEPHDGLASALWNPGADPMHTGITAVRMRALDEARSSTATPRGTMHRRGEASAADAEPLQKWSDCTSADATTSAGVRTEAACSLGWTSTVPTSEVLDYRNHLAIYRPISKCRETRAIEKEERRRHADHEELRRRKQLSFCKSIAAHRDEVHKWNRARRNDAAKCARACKQHFEALSHRAEVEESKAERRRLHALRANDMEAYSKLVEETKNERLKFLLEQTDNYIVSITEKIKAQRRSEENDEARQAAKQGVRAAKRARILADGTEVLEEKGRTTEEERRRATSEYYAMTHQSTEEVRQPKMLVGGQLKEYQLAGLSWLVSLYNNRLNGILADEMGLGKTIQSIALLAHLAEEKRNYGPFMVVAPLSTLSNWANELAKWAPGLVALCYKGPPAARKEVQKEIQQYLATRKRASRGVVPSRAEVGKKSAKSTFASSLRPHAGGDDDEDEDMMELDEDDDESAVVGADHEKPNFSVLLTTYEYVMRDRAVLRKVDWQYIIVDEGHRMKNANSKFAQTLGNLYTARRRLLLTGTPLQNSLPELWALLNYLLPSIFSSVDTFEGWFSKPFSQFGSAQQSAAEEGAGLGHEERMLVINRLHEVLRPFVLRRVKASVLGQLPEKIEKVIRCELSAWQKVLYEQVRSSRASSDTTSVALAGSTALKGDDEDDTMSGESSPALGDKSEKSATHLPHATNGSRGLNNVLMQLRKCCNHPYLFRVDAYRIDELMIRASGKFLLLDSMLPMFKAAGHRVLLFSQMTAVMDLLEEFFTYRGVDYLRLDGSTPSDERERRVAKFNDPCSPTFVFLLSTRAGGLGINLASADTVVIFDSDWNPMMDAQAQDRAHRIGQRNDVRVFRLVAAAPIEERILARATDKLNMNSLVVEAGKFNKDSRAHERRQMLETLLKEYAGDDQNSNAGSSSDADACATSSAQQLAETIATSAEELALYNRCQAQRQERGETLVPMTEDEVPAWVRAGADSSLATLSREPPPFLDTRQRAARRKKDAPYYDSLSERSFIKLLETGSLDKPRPSYKALGRPGNLKVKLRLIKRATSSGSGTKRS